MIIPVRCFSCGKPIGASWGEYQKLLGESVKEGEALDKLKITRFCCRGSMISHIESIDTIGSF